MCQLPVRPMSAELVLPPVPAVLEARQLPWRDTSAVLVATAVIGAVIMLLGAHGGAAMCLGKGSWPEGACYTPGARTADR